jgi:hypothetical protein
LGISGDGEAEVNAKIKFLFWLQKERKEMGRMCVCNVIGPLEG